VGRFKKKSVWGGRGAKVTHGLIKGPKVFHMANSGWKKKTWGQAGYFSLLVGVVK